VPAEALREMIINAVIHRDLSLASGYVAIAVFDNRIEVRSVGELPFGLERLCPIHRPLGAPNPGDWLARHRERGQTWQQWRASSPICSARPRWFSGLTSARNSSSARCSRTSWLAISTSIKGLRAA